MLTFMYFLNTQRFYIAKYNIMNSLQTALLRTIEHNFKIEQTHWQMKLMKKLF
jgi:hypothetical protein